MAAILLVRTTRFTVPARLQASSTRLVPSTAGFTTALEEGWEDWQIYYFADIHLINAIDYLFFASKNDFLGFTLTLINT